MTLRSIILMAGFALALAACDGLMKSDADQGPVAQPKRPPVDHEAQIEADIMVGRVEVMQDQTGHGLEVLGVARPAWAELPTDRDTFRRLSDAVERYNDLNKSACTGGAVTGNLYSGTPYLPLWYAGRAKPDNLVHRPQNGRGRDAGSNDPALGRRLRQSQSQKRRRAFLRY